jgi:hypothetical protein
MMLVDLNQPTVCEEILETVQLYTQSGRPGEGL